MRLWWLAGAIGLLCVATGALPWHDTSALLNRTASVLVFLVAITIVAELADRARLFEVAAYQAARLSGQSVPRLFVLVVLLASLTTAFLSLDTTAVLLTPVVLAIALQLDLAVLPFALVTVWLSNAASLLLPVSNLTNLLALRTLDTTSLHFLSLMWLPEIVSIAIVVAVLGIAYRRDLRGRFTLPESPVVADRVSFVCALVACIGLALLFLFPIPVALSASGCAVFLVAVALARDRAGLRWALVPWQLLVLVLGLFLTIATLSAHGLTHWLEDMIGTGNSFGALLRMSGVSGAFSNVANNLPTYLATEPVAHGQTDRLFALLVGTNVSPLILLWASLATLLWRERCKARGVQIGAWQFARLGLVGAPLLVVGCTAALFVTSHA